ncbi:MAG: tryptophan--tRNA ligase, partial [Candidatus Thermoplasmatota archaeon]|nr:tryptophan--tRNA ligase [Candidatus Thermoplasmatota archaeon]
FMFKDALTLPEAQHFAYENALDVIALGFDPKKTKIIIDTKHANKLYPLAIQVAKRVTFSTAKAVFGFDNSTNIGSIFFTSMQAAPAFLPSVEAGKNVPCLIPCAIDQDPHFRVARDVAPQLGYYKPALIHCKMLPSLAGGDKMSASIPQTTIFTTDAPKVAKKKVMSAFTGGAATVEEQRKNGANPDVCSVFSYYYYLFEYDDAKLAEIEQKCRSGAMLCGECKMMLAEKLDKFLVAHQEKREAARDRIHDFIKD